MSYLRFQEASPKAGWPPGSVAVLARRGGDLLGVISWYPPWKEYVIEPKPDTVWSRGCLREVTDKIVSMTYARELEEVGPAARGPGGPGVTG